MSDKSERQIAAFVETIVSPEYRAVTNEMLTITNPNYEEYYDQRNTAEAIVMAGIQSHLGQKDHAWETFRQAVCVEDDGTNLGLFSIYLQKRAGPAEISKLDNEDLPDGRPEAVIINRNVMNLARVHVDPIDFLSNANETIAESKAKNARTVGPENYATALKLFSDKLKDSDVTNFDEAKIKTLINQLLEGFILATADDAPNFIEMTNIFVAMRAQPTGTIDRANVAPIVSHGLHQLPTFKPEIINVMFGALTKLDVSQCGESSTALIDLAIRKRNGFETTNDMRLAARAIANLPPNKYANGCFKTFLEARNNLEQPLDLEGMEDINTSLARIVNGVIDDPTLTAEAQKIAESCAVRAMNMVKIEQYKGALSSYGMTQIINISRRIVRLYTEIALGQDR